MSLFASRCTLATALALALSAAPVAVYAQVTYDFDLPEQPLADSLRAVGSKASVNVAFQPAAVQGRRAAALKGSYSAREALEHLIEGMQLTLRTTDGGSYLIEAPDAQASGDGRTPAAPSSQTSRLADPQEPGSVPYDLQSDSNVQPDSEESKATRGVATLDELVVTGTRIRGGTTASPTITLGSEQIQEEGFSDLGQVIRSIPQNFAGGQNPGVSSGAATGGLTNQNITGGSAINLRGLGPDATLTLLNGRRLAYDGFGQAVDVSAIPVEAVERVEIVPDGASAIYGSDAVGGVANVVLKTDFDGATLGARYGGATEGGLSTSEYTATVGTTWATGGVIATWREVSSDPIFVDQRNYTSGLPGPNTIFPGIDSSNALLGIRQSLGDVVELRLDALRTRRDQTQYIAYSTYHQYLVPTTSILLVSPSIEFALPRDWSLTAGGTYGESEYTFRTFNVTQAGSLFAQHGCYCNESTSYEIGVEGPLFSLAGGDARLAAGVGQRTDEYAYRPYLSSTGYDGKGRARYGYAEVNLPLVSPSSAAMGIHRLALSAAVRGEDHDAFGQVTTPKLGVVYGPSRDFTLKTAWGRSFKAPTLYQRHSDNLAALFSASTVGGSGYPSDATVLMSYGSNPDLEAERARTWTISAAFHPESIPGLEAEVTWFDIHYVDRVMQPASNYLLALSNPSYAEFVNYAPTEEQQAELLATLSTFQNYAGVPYDPSRVVAIIHNQYINVARQRIQGLDLSGSYRLDLGNGRLTIRGSSSRLGSRQQNSPGQDFHDLAGTIFHPAKHRSRLGGVWTKGGLTTSSFINYTSGVTSELTAVNEETASFTTVDAVIRYDLSARGGLMSGLVFELSANNLLNRNPPFYTTASPSHVPYDSTNYSAIGRFLSGSISKRW